MVVIKNCPFCNWHDVEIDEIDMGRFSVCCPECETIGPVANDINAAIRSWNNRTEHRTILDPK